MQVQVHITAGKQLKEQLNERLRQLKIGVAGVFGSAVVRYQAQARARAPADTGALRNSIKVRRPSYRQSTQDKRFGTIRAAARVTAPYWRFVEFGTIRTSLGSEARTVKTSTGQSKHYSRRRAKGMRKLPPITSGSGLAAWAERKGFNPWAVQKSIGGASWRHQGGSKGKPFWYPVALSEPARIDPEIQAVARRAFE